jgi:BMFP domain-containing protein YqiC
VSGLEEISREELLALVVAQAKRIETLTQRVAELERRLASDSSLSRVFDLY